MGIVVTRTPFILKVRIDFSFNTKNSIRNEAIKNYKL